MAEWKDVFIADTSPADQRSKYLKDLVTSGMQNPQMKLGVESLLRRHVGAAQLHVVGRRGRTVTGLRLHHDRRLARRQAEGEDQHHQADAAQEPERDAALARPVEQAGDDEGDLQREGHDGSSGEGNLEADVQQQRGRDHGGDGGKAVEGERQRSGQAHGEEPEKRIPTRAPTPRRLCHATTSS